MKNSMSGIDNKVDAKTSKSTMGKTPSQPFIGKIKSMTSMGNGATMGQGVKTVPSNPIQGKGKSSGTAMGSGGVIDGFV